MLGGFVIILIGVVISGSVIWGLVDNIYSMNGGLAPAVFIILGVGTIILGALILTHKPEVQADAGLATEKQELPLRES